MSKRIIHVSEGQRTRLRAHLDEGCALLGRNESSEGDKSAWIRRAAALLHILSPLVGNMDYGVAGRVFRDLMHTKDFIDALKLKGVARSDKVHERFQGALGSFQGLVDCIEFQPEFATDGEDVSQKVNAYFFDIPNKTDDGLVFVLMPFLESWSRRIWESHIKPTVEGLNLDPRLQCKRADDLYGHDVMRDIVCAISAARVIVADITGRNPNVFYELGIAHWMGKRVILLSQSADDIPFDLLRFRHVLYEDNSDGYTKLKRGLEAGILESVAR